MTYLERNRAELARLTNYLLQVAYITNVDRLSEVKKAVTMITNAYDYVVEHERKIKDR